MFIPIPTPGVHLGRLRLRPLLQLRPTAQLWHRDQYLVVYRGSRLYWTVLTRWHRRARAGQAPDQGW